MSSSKQLFGHGTFGIVRNVLNLMGTIEQKEWLVDAICGLLFVMFYCSINNIYGSILVLNGSAPAECLERALNFFRRRGKSAKNTEQ